MAAAHMALRAVLLMAAVLMVGLLILKLAALVMVREQDLLAAV
jgi:hypothetical protein